MPNTRFNPEEPTVFIVGTGFSADLGFPLAINPFAIRSRLPPAERRWMEEVLQQHYPRFQADEATTYPSMEELLAKLLALEQQQHYFVANGNRMTFSEPRDLRRLLLTETAEWFMERQQGIMHSPPGWLSQLQRWVLDFQPTLIAFNWDLVLDQLLYGNTLSAQTYGVGLPSHVPALLKPHGSLNWYEVENAVQGRPDRDTFRIGSSSADCIMAYRNLEASSFPPRGLYTPAVFPEAFLRNVGSASFREIDRSCIERLSKARYVVFLGYSMPETDLHARSLFLAGLLGRDDAIAPSVLTVNRDAGTSERLSALLGKSLHVEQDLRAPKEWIADNL